ncbi:MAG: DUF1592 domain-containing protein [Planctomycetaceae bacterium]
MTRSATCQLFLSFLGVISLGLFCYAGAAKAADTVPPDVLKNLVTHQCIACHGPDEQKSGIRLDDLSFQLQSEATFSVWQKVHDAIASGKMPPKDAVQKSLQDERNTAVRILHDELHEASLRQQNEQGRVRLRRLNTTEYETTLHDLLQTSVPLRELLPEDTPSAGFDNVSSSLDLSATHFLKYQEAAAAAIASVVPVGPPIGFSDTRTGKDMTLKGPNFREGLGRNSLLKGDSLIIYSKLPRYGLCATAAVPQNGRYRIRMKAAAVGAEGKAISVGLMRVMQSGRESPVLYDVVDIPHGEPQEIEFECDLVSRQQFVVNLLTTWDIRRFKKPIEEYTGPGLIVDWMKVEGPVGEYPSESYQALFRDVPLKARSVLRAEQAGRRVPEINPQRSAQQWEADPLVPASANPREDLNRLIRDFLPRAFRRPVGEQEAKIYVDAAIARLEQGSSFYDAATFGYQLILTSPSFLFLLDSPPGKPLDSYSLASRLSYFLWSSSPDDELLARAADNTLIDPAVLRSQVDRMLDSPKARRFTKNFVGQWLDLRKIDATIPDPTLYADFDQMLLWSMPRETELFFEEVLRNDLSVLNFVHSDWTMLNERLSVHYGVTGPQGSGFQRVQLPADSHRGGVMTQASVLKVTADGTRTSPVLRGVWVLHRMLGTPPSPPPPDVPPIEPDIRGATTIRQQLDLHRNTPACASCHKEIDPPGFALESYDPIGNWRTFYRVTTRTPAGPVDLPYGSGRPVYRGPDVELGGQTPDGRPFSNIDEYKALILEDKDQIIRNLVQKITIYATGSDIQFADREVIEQIVQRLKNGNSGLRSLIHEVVQSRMFLNK